MIQGVSTVISGVETSISDGVLSILRATQGLGMAPMHHNTQRSPMEHGATWNDYRLDPRDISLIFIIQGTRPERTTKRRQLIGLFHPDFTTTLRFSTDNGRRDIDVKYAGDMDLPSDEHWPALQRIRLRLVAHKPAFLDPDGVSVPFAQVAGGGGLTFPMLLPFTLGASTVNQTQVIDTTGDPSFWRADPIITITGPITDPILTNLLTGDKLDFTGTTIAGGTTYTIDCRFGQKTVVDQAGTNQISKLAAGSSIATFNLRRGANSLSLVGTSASAATLLTIFYNGQYLAI